MRKLFILLGIFAALTFATHALAQTATEVNAQTAASESASSAAAATIIAQFLSSVKVSGFVTWAIQLMKDNKTKIFSWIGPTTPWVTRAVAVLGAALTAGGIDAVWNGMNHSLIITGLSAPAILHAVWHTAQNYLVQKGWYKTVFAEGAQPAPAAAAAVAVKA